IEILPDAKAVLLHAESGFTTNLDLVDFFEEDVLMAFGLNGNALNHLQGFPLRLIVPKLYAYKSIKWLVRIEFTKENIPGYWEQRGYHNHADPWKEERYS
ncbi:MAG: molybdopterin-dependent oxidoreductase, partial [bacterium]|nr:molybdopterin-dependent oxidoreductase [bacterium]